VKRAKASKQTSKQMKQTSLVQTTRLLLRKNEKKLMGREFLWHTENRKEKTDETKTIKIGMQSNVDLQQ